jgi:hypothetical protein
LTFGLVAPRDKSLTIVGDKGVLFVGNVRNDGSPVYVRHAELSRWQAVLWSRHGALDRFLTPRIQWPSSDLLFQRRYPFCREPRAHHAGVDKPVDFLRGPDELIDAIREQRECRLSGRFAAHVVELTERLQWPDRFASTRVDTTFPPIAPMPWAV